LNKATGKARCWPIGYKSRMDCSDMDFTGFNIIKGAGHSWTALNNVTGKALCWGDPAYGGTCPDKDFTGFTDVYSTVGAFMALNKKTGQGHCWGRVQNGGDCKGKDFTGITDVYSTSTAFMAFNKATGQGFCWGVLSGLVSLSQGPPPLAGPPPLSGESGVHQDPCKSQLQAFTGDRRMTEVYSTKAAFVAINKIKGLGLCIGTKGLGGDCSGIDFTGVTDIYSNPSAFVALNKNTGKVQCWGDRSFNCNNRDFSFMIDAQTQAPTPNPTPTPAPMETPKPTPEPMPEPEYCQPHGDLDNDVHNDMPLCANGDVTWSCSSRGSYRKQCPAIAPYMCAKKSCDGGQDHCCETDCGTPDGPYGGRRPACR